jgi:transcriptional regulator with XRE-family HTH domain
MARLNNIGMTKYDLARSTGYSSYLLDDVLLGKKPYTPQMLISFSKTLRVSIDYLIK